MRKSLLATWVAFALCAVADEPVDLDRIAALNRALQDGGVTGLLAVVSEHRWDAPWMPSKWHVENRVRDAERIKVADAGRGFGLRLAKHLESVAEQFQTLPPGEELCSLSHRMCDLSDWCASADGRENLFLALRCLDIAAVGLGRVAASLDFPLEKCRKLAARMSPKPNWMSVERRARVLDREAGTNLFAACQSQKEMDRVWASGNLLRLKGKVNESELPPRLFSRENFTPTPAMEANLDFFNEDGPRPSPPTCCNFWDRRDQQRLVSGLEPQTADKALKLLRFREAVGHFPGKFTRTPEELRIRDKQIAEASKWGRKITKAEDDPYFDPLKESFRLAWRSRANRDKNEINNYDYVAALQAYREITAGRFYDYDTAQIRRSEPMPEWQKTRIDAEEKAAAEARMRYKENQGKP